VRLWTSTILNEAILGFWSHSAWIGMRRFLATAMATKCYNQLITPHLLPKLFVLEKMALYEKRLLGGKNPPTQKQVIIWHHFRDLPGHANLVGFVSEKISYLLSIIVL
jgi:hypothetical protein